MKSKFFNYVVIGVAAVSFFFIFSWAQGWIREVKVLKKVIERLSADSRAAEVLVTKSEYDEVSKKIKTTIKFLEFDVAGQPLPPRYFTFTSSSPWAEPVPPSMQGNIIQFQALVVRFDDKLVSAGDKIKGKSIYLFTKAFVLNGKDTQEFPITPAQSIPSGYKVPGIQSDFEKKLWKEFWAYALDPKKSAQAGIKNAQIEAPGSLFLPGTIYTLRIEHDGGLRIDAKPVPEILKGESL